MENINSNINNRYNVSNGAINVNPNVQQTLDKSKQAVTQSVMDNPAGGMLKEYTDPMTIAMLPALYGVNTFVNHTMGGDLDKSLLGKIAKFGDRISSVFKLDKLHTGSGKISEFLHSNRFFKYFTDEFKAIPKSNLAQSSKMVDSYSAKLLAACKLLPENHEAIAETLGASYTTLSAKTREFLLGTLTDITAVDAAEIATELSQKGFDKFAIQTKRGAKTYHLSQAANKYKAAASQIGESHFGKTMAKGALKTKDVVTFHSESMLGLIFLASAITKSIKATKEAPKGEKLSTFAHVMSENYLGVILWQPSISLFYKLGGNKYRGLDKAGLDAYRNFVNSTNANLIFDKSAYKIAQLQKNLLLKGVPESEVATLAGKSLAEARTLAKGLASKGAKLKFWEKPLKAAGAVMDTGLDRLQKPVGKIGKSIIDKCAASDKCLAKLFGSAFEGLLKKRPSLSGFAGGLGRFLIIMFVLAPMLQKPLTKLVHKIFGEPKTYLEKEKSNSAQKQPEQSQTPAAETTEQNVPSSPQVINKPQNNNQTQGLYTRPTNILSQRLNQTQTSAQPLAVNPISTEESQPLTPVDEEIAASGLSRNKEKRYIPKIEAPSQEDETVNPEFEARAKMLISQAENHIKNAQKLL
ncbi:hypothetical protein II906_09170 [bacterium]|nr:hypothetical protein [bacterium]